MILSQFADQFHGEFSSADASALTEVNSRFTLYGVGSATGVTLGANDYVVVKDIVITTGAALTVDIYDGANNAVAAGESIAKVIVNGTIVLPLTVPHVCAKGTYPKVKTSGAGQVDVVIRGHIVTG